MPSGRARAGDVAACALALLSALAAPAYGQAALPASAGREVGPFTRTAIGIEFAAGGHGELWHLNGGREWLATGSAAMWWAFGEGRSLIVQFHATEVFQRERNAFVNAVVPSLRWRIVEGQRVDVFTEIGTGLSWSDTQVPPRGTLFNYVAEAGVGLARRIGRQTSAIAGLRLLHVSNGNREGSSRNPDIEALGAYAGLSVGF